MCGRAPWQARLPQSEIVFIENEKCPLQYLTVSGDVLFKAPTSSCVPSVSCSKNLLLEGGKKIHNSQIQWTRDDLWRRKTSGSVLNPFSCFIFFLLSFFFVLRFPFLMVSQPQPWRHKQRQEVRISRDECAPASFPPASELLTVRWWFSCGEESVCQSVKWSSDCVVPLTELKNAGYYPWSSASRTIDCC